MGNRHDTERASRRPEHARALHVRNERLEELIREEANFLLDSEINDPSLEGVRVTQVSLSPDGSRARIHYTMSTETPFQSETTPRRDFHEIEAALERASGFFRRRLCEAMSLKRTPELRFTPDFTASSFGDDGAAGGERGEA